MWCSLSHIRLSFDHIEHTIESIFKMYLSVYKLGTFSLYKDCWPQAAPRTEYLSQEDRNVCVCVCLRGCLSRYVPVLCWRLGNFGRFGDCVQFGG